jgi:branched-chain amino acid transport system permease protein
MALIDIGLTVGALVAVYIVAGFGLNLQWGDTGLMNFGVAAFIGIGAYTSVLLTTPAIEGLLFERTVGYDYPLVIGLLGSFVVSALFGLILAASSIRVSGDYLALVTIAFSQIIHAVALSESWLTGGNQGIFQVDPLVDPTMANEGAIILGIISVVIVIGYVLLTRLSTSSFGRILHGIREDEDVTRALGKDSTRFKLKVFAIGAGFQGLAGALLAHYTAFFSPAMFPLALTFLIWTGLIIGGSGSYRGIILGVALVMTIHQAVRFLPQDVPLSSELPYLRTILIGAMLILVLYYRPYGLLGDKERLSAGGKLL